MNWIEPLTVDFVPTVPDLHPLVSYSLYRRGIITPEATRAFLDPHSYTSTPPEQLPGLIAIVDRLEQAIHNHESICIWGDFDADGQTSTTILYQTLQELRANVSYHIPIRETESHGVNLPHLKEIVEAGARVILTCDTGITAHAAVDYANSQGVAVLITDHHDLADTLPDAFALTDPKLLPEGNSLSTLSGSGVSYKLAEALYVRFERPLEQLRKYLDLTAIGLVADLARLTGEARFLVQLGLDELRHTGRLGLQTMMKMAKLDPENLTEEHIGYILGPRLNALGRMGDANPVVELMTTSDPVRARVLAATLEALNTQRQLLCNQVTQAAEAQLLADPSLLTNSTLVLGHASWPGGVVGIVASRLVERYQKPSILFSIPPGAPAHGSARSVDGLNITAAIAAQKDLLLNFGGHPMAAGLSLDAEKLTEFRLRLSKTVEEMLGKIERKNLLEIADWLSLPEITNELVHALESLAPFGPGNEKLILATHGLSLLSTSLIGRNREHMKLIVTDKAGNERTVLWWNGAAFIANLPKVPIDLAYTLRYSDWQGSRRIQMEFVDFRDFEFTVTAVPRKQLNIVDYRNAQEPLQILTSLPDPTKIQIWAEGFERKVVEGVDRYSLRPLPGLALWTIPPSPADLQALLKKTQAGIIYLFAVTPADQSLDDFVSHLAGLAKFAINHRQGRLTWKELETATAQRTITIRTGMEWLAALGLLVIQSQKDGDLVVTAGVSQKDPDLAAHLSTMLESLLAETSAYREVFKTAEKESLFGDP